MFRLMLVPCLLAVAAWGETADTVYKPDTTGEASVASAPARAPALHGPRVIGATPGRPFLFLIPAAGAGPLTFSAENLPEGLALDASTGIISGVIVKPGTSKAMLKVTGAHGTAKRALRIVAADHSLALTPPMGWNSWNIWARDVTDQNIRDAADGMVKSGLAAHGYQYINLDDCWEAKRDANGKITANERFPAHPVLAYF